MLDLDSKEERGGTSLANSTEAALVVNLYSALCAMTNQNKGIVGRVAVVTPYSQQAKLLKDNFRALLGSQFTNFVEIGTVDAFQGREGMCLRVVNTTMVAGLLMCISYNFLLCVSKHCDLLSCSCSR